MSTKKPKAEPQLTEVMLPIGELVANPRNPRRHPETQLEHLQESVRRFGQPRSILARAANKMIIAGHGIWQAMEREGHTAARVLLWDVDQKTADAYMLADNRLAALGKEDPDQVRALLADIEAADWGAVGFGDEEAQAVLDELEDELEVKEIETGPVDDRFWISIRGPLGKQAAALARLQEAMKDLGAEVEVELGTTAI